ncbi:MAG TPA: hypothetical protein VFB68_16640 [Xanthobacteraceae bacterium]|nr:hypothetical protein [Xanthobacteraceae bacterium]
MEGTLGRSCLILALLSALLAVTLAVNPGARADGAAVATQAATMQLQGNADTDETGIPEHAKNAIERCDQDDLPRPLKQELAFLLAEYPQVTESKNFMVSYDGTKSKD